MGILYVLIATVTLTSGNVGVSMLGSYRTYTECTSKLSEAKEFMVEVTKRDGFDVALIEAHCVQHGGSVSF